MHVVGTIDPPGTGVRPYIWHAGTWNVLPILPNHTLGFGYAINESLVAVGMSTNNVTGPLTAVRWINGNIEEFNLPYGANSYALDINERGDIVGWMGQTTTTNSRAFVRWADGTIQDLGTVPGGYTGYAVAINNHGHILINGRTSPQGQPIVTGSYLWVDGTFQPLGNLVINGLLYETTAGIDLNDHDEIVGIAGRIDGPATGFYWKGGVIRYLREMIPTAPTPAQQVWMYNIGSINNHGQIAGSGFDFQPPSRNFGVVLTPVRTVEGDATCDGVVNVSDLLRVLSTWGACPPFDCHSDIDDNGVVNQWDLFLVLANWGRTGPS